MAGTVEGGKAAANTNIKKYGEDFYRRIGARGGSSVTLNTKLRGFASNKELARTAGAKGGRISRRGEANG